MFRVSLLSCPTHASSGPSSRGASLATCGPLTHHVGPSSLYEPFADHFVPASIRKEMDLHVQIPERSVEVRYSENLAADVRASLKQSYRRIGASEFIDRGNRVDVSRDANSHAATVGA